MLYYVMYIIKKIIKVGEELLKKYLIRFGLVGTFTFLSLFIYFYKTSGKFRQSIITAFVIVFFSSQQPAYSAGEADAFTTQQQHQSRPQSTKISNVKSTNNGSGPEKPDDFNSDSGSNGFPQYPQRESVEKTEKRIQRIDEYLRQMNEVTDSSTESESEDDFAKYPSVVTVKEALQLPNIRAYEEAKKYAAMNVPESLNVNEQHHISGVMAAKKTSHALEIGLNPVDYGMKAEHVTLIRGMGLYEYLQKGYPLPPASFLRDYQNRLKDICLEAQTQVLSDKSYTHNCKTPISIYENQNMSKSGKSSAIVVFDENTGDMITLGKRGKKYMTKVKESGNMGTGGGRL